MNQMISEITDDPKAQKTFSGYINEIWQYAMEHSDTNLKTAPKPKRKGE